MDAILAYYEQIPDRLLAARFYAEFWHSVDKAARHPKLYPERIGGLRRMNLRRFPFYLLFEILEDQVHILVVRHHARMPLRG